MSIYKNLQKSGFALPVAFMLLPVMTNGLFGMLFAHSNYFLFNSLVDSLSSIQTLLSQIGPIISGVLFIVAGIMYSIGQLLTPEKKAQFHTTSINIIIGAIIVAVLSVTSNSFAFASAHLLSNLTINAT
jgi:hypothetical protein